jgi:hypothetical protein
MIVKMLLRRKRKKGFRENDLRNNLFTIYINKNYNGGRIHGSTKKSYFELEDE